MKTNYRIQARTSLWSGLALALAFGLWTPGVACAEVELKGYERSLQMRGLNTRAQAEALKPGDTIAMACAKCKSVVVQIVTIEKGHIRHVTPGEKHLCPGCNSYIKVVGVGKESKNELRHVCDKCGDSSAFCCATKPGEAATKGMEKEKK
jgi:hypothetical protein